MKFRRKRELPDWDDGRTIAPMDAEGMPWAREPRSSVQSTQPSEGEELSPRELRMFTAGAVKAALVVVGVMSAAIIAFVLFCQFIWFA